MTNSKKNFVWNIFGLTFNAFNAFAFLLIVKLINGIDTAGIFTYAYAICSLFYFLSTYFNRTYQVSDVNNDYSFNQYYSVRIFTSVLSMVLLFLFSCINGFDSYKIIMIMSVMLFRSIESISDVFYGFIQGKNCLYKVGFSLTIKSILSIIIFTLFDYFTRNVLLSMLLVAVVNIIVLLFYDYKNFLNMSDSKLELDFSKLKSILFATFSVFIFSFLQTYLLNEQKYVITYFVENDIQTIFGILIMPATVLSMMCNYLIFPYVGKFSDYYANNKIEEFKKLGRVINIVLLLFGIAITIATYFIGIPVLNFVFRVNLNNYHKLLIIIIISSVIYAISTVLSNLLTIMRHNTSQSIIYFVVSIIGTIISYFLISSYGIYGATYSYLINFVVLLVAITMLYIVYINKGKNKLEKYKVVSFDMFDTLVSRAVNKPTDVFDLIQEKYNLIHKNKIESFKEYRISAEKEAYTNLSNGIEEITFDAIYQNLEKKYSKKICEELKKLELEFEYSVCIPNKPIIKKYYDYCRLNNKRIIVTSDMYLPKRLLEKILKKCGIEYDYLYLSNVIGKKKRRSMFDYVVDKENIKKSELVHIGDNLIIDYISPIRKHIKSIKVNRKKYKNNLDKVIDIFLNDNDFYYRFGYKNFGPILLGYCKFLNENLKDNKKYFLSRDGYLMKLAYESIYGKSKNNIYMYASRRSLIVPTIWSCNTYAEMFSKFTIKDKLTIKQAFKILGLNQDIVSKKISNKEMEKEINKNYLFEDEFQNKYQSLIEIVKNNSKEEYNNLCLYLKSIKFDNNSNIIDIGWNGNMQLALCKLFEFQKKDPNVKGYYIGVDKNSKNIDKIMMNGYLFDNKKNLDIFYSEKSINNLFESFFLAPHGTVLKYNSDNTPVLAEYEYTKEEAEIYTKIQTGALDFLNDIVKCNIVDYICKNSIESYDNMKKFSYSPSQKMIKNFGDIQFVDNGVFYIAKPKSILYYALHPTRFLRDLQTSGWMIGFMKRLTKIDFGYKRLYIFMFRKYEKNRYNKEKKI